MNLSRIVRVILCILLIECSANAQSIKKTKKSTKTTSTSASSKTNGTTNSTGLESTLGTLSGLLNSSSGSKDDMTNDLAAKGLKEALNSGATLAVNNLGQIDGFLANAAVKILFPPEAKKLENTLRTIGMGSVCDQVIHSVNRAAEAAVIEAKPVFVTAIQQMTITDAIHILTGQQNAATQYLQKTSGSELMTKFEPIIQSNLEKTEATKYWSQAITAYNAVPFVQKVNPNLSQYVTQKATDGIFLMVAEEEVKIRANPTARVGSILKDVFGWADKQKK